MDDLTGRRLGSCVIIRHLRSGGMGDIYLANQPDLGRQVAVKVIRPDLGATIVGDSIADFLREARAVAALEHPHILPIYDFGEVDGLPYLVMQYVPTGSLADLMGARATPGFTLPLTPDLAATIITQTAAALQYAHDRDVMHLDVKPHNMLMRLLGAPSDPKGAPQPHVLLADFGLARTASLTGSGTPASGTPLYAAPEQFAGAAVPASDQYALAGVAFQLLTGSPLFSGSLAELLHQHQSAPPPLASVLNPHLPLVVNAIFARALAKEPYNRYPRIEIFAQQLSAALHTATGADTLMAAPLPVPPRAPMHMPDQSFAPGAWVASGGDTALDNAATVDAAYPGKAPPNRAPAPMNRPPTPWNAAPLPVAKPPRPQRTGGSANRLLLIVAALLIVASLTIAGVILLPPLFTTTVVVKRVPAPSVCASVPKFKAANAGAANAGAPFADVPFPTGSLSYGGGTTTVNGKSVRVLHACSPSLTDAAAHTFFSGNMPAKGWTVSSSFPVNNDGQCGDAYCWTKGGHFVGLDTPTNGSGYVVYDLRLVL